MTIEQAASFLQIATTDIERWQATEKLASCIQKRGKHVRIWRHGLVEWFFDKDQERTVANVNRNLTFVEKRHLGLMSEQVDERLRSGYCMAFFMFEDGRGPDFYIIPGYAWLTPNALLKDNQVGDQTYGPNLEVSPTKKLQPILEKFRFSNSLLEQIIRSVSGIDLKAV